MASINIIIGKDNNSFNVQVVDKNVINVTVDESGIKEVEKIVEVEDVEGKKKIAKAITDKGINADKDETLSSLSEKISSIEIGITGGIEKDQLSKFPTRRELKVEVTQLIGEHTGWDDFFSTYTPIAMLENDKLVCYKYEYQKPCLCELSLPLIWNHDTKSVVNEKPLKTAIDSMSNFISKKINGELVIFGIYDGKFQKYNYSTNTLTSIEKTVEGLENFSDLYPISLYEYKDKIYVLVKEKGQNNNDGVVLIYDPIKDMYDNLKQHLNFIESDGRIVHIYNDLVVIDRGEGYEHLEKHYYYVISLRAYARDYYSWTGEYTQFGEDVFREGWGRVSFEKDNQINKKEVYKLFGKEDMFNIAWSWREEGIYCLSSDSRKEFSIFYYDNHDIVTADITEISGTDDIVSARTLFPIKNYKNDKELFLSQDGQYNFFLVSVEKHNYYSITK